MSELKKINGINLTINESGTGQDMILIHGRGYSFEIIPNAGHIAFFENKEQVLSLIDNFIIN